MAVMPMFPLGAVLFPGGVLPLHVFEPRYRRLVQDLLDGEPEFGVTLIEKGSEVGGGDQRSAVGTVARLVRVAEMPDGRYAIVSVGVRRIRVVRWLEDDPYPRAEVEDWPDDRAPDPDGPAASVAPAHAIDPAEPNDPIDPADPIDATGSRQVQALLEEASRHVRRVLALAVELGVRRAAVPDELSSDPVVAGYQLSALAPFGPADQYRLLAAPDPTTRLRLLHDLLEDVEAGLRFHLLPPPGDQTSADPGPDAS